MQTVVIVVHLLIVLALIGVVLLQRSEGGLGLGGGGGGGGGVGGFMTGRGQANALTRATAILATAFFITSLVLGIMAHRGAAPKSIFEGTPSSGSGQPAAPAVGGEPPLQLGTPPAPASPATPPPPSAPQSR